MAYWLSANSAGFPRVILADYCGEDPTVLHIREMNLFAQNLNEVYVINSIGNMDENSNRPLNLDKITQ